MNGSRRRLHIAVVASVLLTAVLSAPSPAVAAADSWSSLAATVAAIAPQTSFLVAEVIDGDCYPVLGVTPERRIAIASTFKLYVLAELARQIATDRAAWDEVLTVSDGLKSKPSGAMRYEAEGTGHSLRYFAEQMIAESDNTATDHLIARLGRENVESVQKLLGHGAPELNTPLLMTRELFALKIAVDAEFVEAYLAASDDEQRRMLETRVDPIRLAPEGWGAWDGPTWIDSIEWFASAEEVCLALARLQEMAERPGLEPVGQILGKNRGGTVFDRKTWPYAGLKAGYEAGVFNLSWLLRRADGRSYVVSAGFNDPNAFIDQAAAWQLIERTEALLRTID